MDKVLTIMVYPSVWALDVLWDADNHRWHTRLTAFIVFFTTAPIWPAVYALAGYVDRARTNPSPITKTNRTH